MIQNADYNDYNMRVYIFITLLNLYFFYISSTVKNNLWSQKYIIIEMTYYNCNGKLPI